MKNNPENIAVIDIGSNSVRLFIFRVEGRRAVQIEAQKYFCGLGKDLGTTGKLNPEAASLTLSYMEGFASKIKEFSVRTVFVIGTAALREASDSAAFIALVKERTGLEIKVITGDEEARLAALAILDQNEAASGIVADFGGGSLELAKISRGDIERKISLNLGAHYLKALDDREARIAHRLRNVLQIAPEFSNPEKLYIIGGSWRSLIKAWLADQGRMGEPLQALAFNGADITGFCRTLQQTEPKELIARYQIEAPRAALMDVSSLMLQKLIEEFRPGAVEVSTAGIRDGIVYDYILKTAA